jgi:hypothetical protein
LAGNLVKPLIAVYGNEWRERGYTDSEPLLRMEGNIDAEKRGLASYGLWLLLDGNTQSRHRYCPNYTYREKKMR